MLWEITPDQKKVEIKGRKALIGAEKTTVFWNQASSTQCRRVPYFCNGCNGFWPRSVYNSRKLSVIHWDQTTLINYVEINQEKKISIMDTAIKQISGSSRICWNSRVSQGFLTSGWWKSLDSAWMNFVWFKFGFVFFFFKSQKGKFNYFSWFWLEIKYNITFLSKLHFYFSISF